MDFRGLKMRLEEDEMKEKEEGEVTEEEEE